MTRHDLLSTPPTPQAPALAPAPGRTPGPVRAVRPRVTIPLCLLAFAAVYLIAVCTPFGQRAENFLLSGYDGKAAWIHGWSGSDYGSSAMPPLNQTALPTVFVALALIAVVTLIRRNWWQGGAAIAIVVVALGGKELVWQILPRPDLVNAPVYLTERSFPSGHAAVPIALTLAAALVVSPRVRPYVLTVGMAWLAVTSAAVLATYHHRPSDSLGSALLACVCYLLATRFLPPTDAPGLMHSPRALPAVALTLAAVGALVGGARSDSLLQSLTFATTGFLCAVLVWLTATQGPAPTARRARR